MHLDSLRVFKLEHLEVLLLLPVNLLVHYLQFHFVLVSFSLQLLNEILGNGIDGIEFLYLSVAAVADGLELFVLLLIKLNCLICVLQ